MCDCLKVWLGKIPEDWLLEDKSRASVEMMQVITGFIKQGPKFRKSFNT